MPLNTRERNTALAQAAAAHVAAGGRFSRPECDQFAAANGCTRETARRHLARAVNQMRQAAADEARTWGGVRDGAGRPMAQVVTILLPRYGAMEMLPCIEEARRTCPLSSTQKYLDQLIAALMAAKCRDEE